MPAHPIPGSILVNLGDLMQFWTSDRYTATVNLNSIQSFPKCLEFKIWSLND